MSKVTIIDFVNILEQVGIPYSYSHFNANSNNPPVPPPFMVYLEEDSQNFDADNQVYKKYLDYRLEIYTKAKDLKLEKKIEDLLDSHKIPYDTMELWIDSQKVFERVYYITLTK